ncbi:MAG: MFS transporter [Acutalibacteraceae bacterium]
MKNSKISKRLWFNLILFGLMGQIAWNVENMYFNTFLYNTIYSNGASQAAIDGTMPVMKAISLMVGLSAATAVITTFIMGTLSDKMRKRKVFISVGYIAWGVVTALFGFISRDNVAAIFHLSDEVKILTATVWVVIIMDSVMTFMGSTSNDSAFNAWVTDVTTPENRPKVETLFAALPIVAMGIVVGFGTLAQTGVISYSLFFLALGAFVVCCGIIGLFSLKDPETSLHQSNSNYWSDLFYGFRPSVIKNNSRLYLALCSICFFAVAVQVFFPYILIYLQYIIIPNSSDINMLSASFIVPAVIAVAVMVAGIIILLKLGEKKSKSYAILPASILFVIGLALLFVSHNLLTLVLSATPAVIGYAVLMIMLNAAIRDFTPESKAGQFQGIRMIFYVLIPMILGPAIGSFASANSGITYIDEYNIEQVAPTSHMFLYAAIVSVFVFIPLVFLIKKGFNVEEKQTEE